MENNKKRSFGIFRNVRSVYKTLVTRSASKNYYVFVIPVAEHLDLKKAAKAVKEKSIEMIRQDELLPLTGYIHGGCSPIGMKKQFRTTFHFEIENLEFSCSREKEAALCFNLIYNPTPNDTNLEPRR